MKAKSIPTCAALAGLVIALLSGGAAAQLAGTERTDFIKSSIKACLDTAHARNPSTPMSNLTTYCTCMADAEADMTTPADTAYIIAHNAASDDYRKRVLALAPACNKKAGLH
jgi:hypothetical protein